MRGKSTCFLLCPQRVYFQFSLIIAKDFLPSAFFSFLLSLFPLLPSATYRCVRSDLFLLPHFPATLTASLQDVPPVVHYHFFDQSLTVYNFSVWSASQVLVYVPSSSFLKIRLPIWEPSHPMLARKRVRVYVCVCFFFFFMCFLCSSIFTHFQTSSSYCVSLCYFVTKITSRLCPCTVCLSFILL